MSKTMAMRRLDQAGLAYEARRYPAALREAAEVAAAIDVPAGRMFKTLVVTRQGGRPLLALVPADRELAPRALAAAVGEKKVAMAGHQEAERLTGLRVGGISPLAVRHGAFDVVLDASALGRGQGRAAGRAERNTSESDHRDTMWLSGGRRGVSLGLSASALVTVLEATVADMATVPRT